MPEPQPASLVWLIGAGCLGVILGWYFFHINRYHFFQDDRRRRRRPVQPSNLLALIGVLAGGAILTRFPSGAILFGAYGVGLAIGFFAHLLALIVKGVPSKAGNGEWEKEVAPETASGRPQTGVETSSPEPEAEAKGISRPEPEPGEDAAFEGEARPQ
jgi:hypothetical protein